MLEYGPGKKLIEGETINVVWPRSAKHYQRQTADLVGLMIVERLLMRVGKLSYKTDKFYRDRLAELWRPRGAEDKDFLENQQEVLKYLWRDAVKLLRDEEQILLAARDRILDSLGMSNVAVFKTTELPQYLEIEL